MGKIFPIFYLTRGKSTVDSVCAFVSRRYAYLEGLISIRCKGGHVRVEKKTENSFELDGGRGFMSDGLSQQRMLTDDNTIDKVQDEMMKTKMMKTFGVKLNKGSGEILRIPYTIFPGITAYPG